MRKPDKPKGQYVPASRPKKPVSSGRFGKTSRSVDIGGMLGKLDAAQLTEIAGGVLNLANNILEYGSEVQRTKQIIAQTNAAIEVSRNELQKVIEEEETKRLAIQKELAENEMNTSLAITKEKNRHALIMRLLDQVENNVISPSQLCDMAYIVANGDS